jgi:hypothetical protein
MKGPMEEIGKGRKIQQDLVTDENVEGQRER